VWLEKQNSQDNITTLGILIGKEDVLGKGVGRKQLS